jgi:hypothetical protein
MEVTNLKKVGIIVGLILILFGAVIHLYYQDSKIGENVELKKEIEAIVRNEDNRTEEVLINMNAITDFDWDRLFILTPYTDPVMFFNGVGIGWNKTINTSIKYNDSIGLLIFTYESEIINYIEYPRQSGDFSDLEVKIRECYMKWKCF